MKNYWRQMTSKELDIFRAFDNILKRLVHKSEVNEHSIVNDFLNDIDVETVKNALNELERLRKFRETFNAYELAKKQDFIAYENWQECEKHNDLLFSLKKIADRIFMGTSKDITQDRLDYHIISEQLKLLEVDDGND